MQAFAVGTPALFVDEGGFRDSIVNGENGRLLARDDIAGWHANLEMVKDSMVREQWSKAGRERISELGLSPENHCSRLLNILDSIHDDA